MVSGDNKYIHARLPVSTTVVTVDDKADRLVGHLTQRMLLVHINCKSQNFQIMVYHE